MYPSHLVAVLRLLPASPSGAAPFGPVDTGHLYVSANHGVTRSIRATFAVQGAVGLAVKQEGRERDRDDPAVAGDRRVGVPEGRRACLAAEVRRGLEFEGGEKVSKSMWRAAA